MALANVTDANATACNELPSGSVSIGVLMGVGGSMGINVGQNLQATGLQSLPEELTLKPHKSAVWIFGLLIFIAFSLLNFAALALAPASILTPLESIQFVTNIAWNRFVNHKAVSRRMLMGVLLAVIGTVLTVAFGAQASGCHSIQQLIGFWTQIAWWAWLAASLSLALASWLLHAEWTRRKRRGEVLPRGSGSLLPIAYTLAAALAGGAQMIVHSKVLSELLAMIFQGDVSPFKTWLLYVELLLVIGCGSLWGFKLTECLALYDPLLILPLMVGTYILFGGVGAGIFFEEFATLHLGHAGAGGWPLYFCGMLLLLCGLGLIADASEGSAGVVDARPRDDDDNGIVVVGPCAAAAASDGGDSDGYRQKDSDSAGGPAVDPDTAAVSAAYMQALASTAAGGGSASLGGITPPTIAPRLLDIAAAGQPPSLSGSLGGTLESVPESEVAFSNTVGSGGATSVGAAASTADSTASRHASRRPSRERGAPLSSSRPLSSSMGGSPHPQLLSSSSRPLSSSLGRRSIGARPLASIKDLSVAVESLAEYERSLSRAVSNTPLASRMPTPFASMRAASELARVRSDLSVLSSHPSSPLVVTPGARSARSASSGSGGRAGSRAVNSGGSGGGAGGARWPAPSAADFADDVEARRAGEKPGTNMDEEPGISMGAPGAPGKQVVREL